MECIEEFIIDIQDQSDTFIHLPDPRPYCNSDGVLKRHFGSPVCLGCTEIL